MRILAGELRRRGSAAERERLISFSYDGMVVEDAFRADLLVEECVIVGVKSVERLTPALSGGALGWPTADQSE